MAWRKKGGFRDGRVRYWCWSWREEEAEKNEEEEEEDVRVRALLLPPSLPPLYQARLRLCALSCPSLYPYLSLVNKSGKKSSQAGKQ